MKGIDNKREALARLLQAGHPGADFSDDEAMYDRILDDYADYARLLAKEADDEAALYSGAQSDGVPCLGGGIIPFAAARGSIFDIARGSTQI